MCPDVLSRWQVLPKVSPPTPPLHHQHGGTSPLWPEWQPDQDVSLLAPGGDHLSNTVHGTGEQMLRRMKNNKRKPPGSARSGVPEGFQTFARVDLPQVPTAADLRCKGIPCVEQTGVGKHLDEVEVPGKQGIEEEGKRYRGGLLGSLSSSCGLAIQDRELRISHASSALLCE